MMTPGFSFWVHCPFKFNSQVYKVNVLHDVIIVNKRDSVGVWFSAHFLPKSLIYDHDINILWLWTIHSEILNVQLGYNCKPKKKTLNKILGDTFLIMKLVFNAL